MPDLAAITTAVNLLALAASLWLGFYVITRSVYSTLSRLATLTLWALAGYFLHNAIAINLPGTGVLTWLRQTVIIVLPLWFHITVLLLPRPKGQPTRLVSLNRVAVILAYTVAIAIIALGLFTREILAQVDTRPAYYTSSRLAGPLYPIFLLFLASLFAMSLLNLWRGREQAPDLASRKRLDKLLVATILAGLGGLWNTVGAQLLVDLPTVVGDGSLGAGVILLGYAVARYAALLEGRHIDRDFVYSVLGVGALTAFYGVVIFSLYFAGQLTFLTLALAIVGVIAASSLFDGIRLALDRLFYRRQFQLLRSNLRALAHEAGTGETLPDRLQAVLDSLCLALEIRQGWIALAQGDRFLVEASHNAAPPGQALESSLITGTELIELPRNGDRALQGIVLAVPLFGGGSQVGLLGLGEKESRRPYRDADLDLIEDLGDQIGSLIHGVLGQEENARTINVMVEDFREKERALQLQMQCLLAAREQPVEAAEKDLSVETLLPQVEDALRRLHDFSYLGDQPLARFGIVEQCLNDQKEQAVTFIDRGKALSQVLGQALERLRPDGPEPGRNQIPPREWHPFLILHDAYVMDEPNRDIMGRLYIGEGTFNRTRRRALRSLAKSLGEMEQSTRAAARS